MSSKNAHYEGSAIPEREMGFNPIFPLSIRHLLHDKSIFAAGDGGSFFTSTDERLAREECEDADRIFYLAMTIRSSQFDMQTEFTLAAHIVFFIMAHPKDEIGNSISISDLHLRFQPSI